MKKITQKELLTEGFWSGFKPSNWGKVARGAVRMGADMLRTVAPEITKPLDDLQTTARGYKKSFKQAYDGMTDPKHDEERDKDPITSKVAISIVNDIKIGLARQNMRLIPKYGIKHHGVDPNNGNRLYILKVTTQQRPKGMWLTVDSRGNQS